MVPYEADEEKVANDIESNLSPKEPTESEFKNEIHRPTGVRLLGIFYMVIGISIVAFAIFLGSAVTLLVLGGVMISYDTAMGSLSGLGDTDDLPIPLEVGSLDPTMISSLDMISGLVGMEGLTNSGVGVNNMEVIMGAMMGAFVIVLLAIFLGIISFKAGRGLLKGKKRARIVTIVFAIISIPLAALYVGKIDDLILFGSFAFDGMVIYYMFRPQVREYFTQTSIKNSIKNSKINT